MVKKRREMVGDLGVTIVWCVEGCFGDNFCAREVFI